MLLPTAGTLAWASRPGGMGFPPKCTARMAVPRRAGRPRYENQLLPFGKNDSGYNSCIQLPARVPAAVGAGRGAAEHPAGLWVETPVETMIGSQEIASHSARVPVPDSLAASLYRESGAEKFGLTAAAFAAVLEEVAGKYLSAAAGGDEVAEFLSRLRLTELALARGCARGNEAAWEFFLNRYRERLYGAAYSLVPSDANARELADSLYADLWGTRTGEGGRISKLNSYTGRGSLEGWLRAILAQEYVNRFRRQRRSVSLEEQTEAGVQFQSEEHDPAEAVDPRLVKATDEALASLPAEDRFILANYYLDGRTLAEIARLLGVHESTISRRLERIVTATRKTIRARLISFGMSRTEAGKSMEIEVTELSVEVRRQLLQEDGGKSVP